MLRSGAGVPSRRYRWAASSRCASAAGRSPARKATRPRLCTATATSCSWSVVAKSRSATLRSSSAPATEPRARRISARRVSARAVQIGSPARRSAGSASRRSSRAAACRPSTHRTRARRNRARAASPPPASRTARSRVASPARVRPAWMRATPNAARASASRAAEPDRWASRTATRSRATAAEASPKSRSYTPITWWAMDASCGVGSAASTRCAPARASRGRAKTIGSSSVGPPPTSDARRMRPGIRRCYC